MIKLSLIHILITQTIRNYWGLGDKPISNIINVLEMNGFILSSINTNTMDIDAFTHYVKINGKEYFCIVVGLSLIHI